MAGENVVGSAWVAIRPDTSGFEDALSGGVAGPLAKLTHMLGPAGEVAAAVIGATIAVAGAAVGMAAKFDSSLSTIRAQTGQTSAQVAAIGNAFLSTGGKSTFTANAIASAFAPVSAQLAQVGGHALTARQALDFMTVAMHLAEATGTDLNSTSAVLSSMLQQLQIPLSGAAKAADELYLASKITNEPVAELAGAIEKLHGRLGPVGGSLSSLSTLFVDLSEHGVSGGRALLAVSAAATTLLSPTKSGEKAIHDLGLSVFNSAGNFVGFQSILAQLAPKLAGHNEKFRIAVENAVLGKGAFEKFDATIMAGVPGWTTASNAVSVHGAAETAAQAATDNLKGAFDRLKSGVADVLTSLGEKLTPILTVMVNAILPALTSAWGVLQGAFKVVSDWVSQHLAPAFKTFGNFITQQFLPAWVSVGRFWMDNLMPALRDLWKAFTVNLLPAIEWIGKAILVMGAVFITYLLPVFEKVVGVVYLVVIKAITALIDIIGGIITAVQDVVNSHTFKSLVDIFSKTFGVLATGIGGIINIAVGIIGAVVGALGKILSWSGWKTIGGVFGGAFGWIGDHVLTPFLKLLDGIVSGIQWIADHVASIPHVLQPGTPSNFPGWQWPGVHAAGGDMAPHGMSWVGEQGPELIKVGSQGAHVYSNAQSKAMSGGTIHQTLQFYGVEDTRAIEAAIARNNRNLVRLMGAH